VVGLVEKKTDLPQAIAMNSSLMNLTRLLGPAIAGFTIAAMGSGMCFLINCLSYLAVIAALLFIKGNFKPRSQGRKSVFVELADGLHYTWQTTPVRALILLLAVYGVGGMAYAMLLPVYVRELHGDAHMLGYLMSASAIGSLAGAAILAARQQVVGLGKWIRQSSFVYALALLGLSWTHSFVPALCLLAVIGFTMIIQTASVNTILQSVVDENKRGRVMSLYMMAFLGTSPIGGLIAGSIADKVGFATTIFACGLYCLLVSAFFQYHAPNIRKATRHIYVEKGLMAAEEERKLLSA
jgi:MFS family permease